MNGERHFSLKNNSSSTGTAKEKLASIQILRGVAALAVVVYHVYVMGKAHGNFGTEVFAAIARPGMLGVNLFFVLSGYIIIRAHQRDIGQLSSIGPYIIKRSVRVYPIYWILSLAYMAAAYVGFGEPDFTWDLGNLVSSAILFEVSQPVIAPLRVAWTLFYEIKFYLLFVAFLISLRFGIIVSLLHITWIAVCLIGGTMDFWNLGSLWYIHFYLGMSVYYIGSRFTARYALPSLLVGSAVVTFFAAYYNYDMTALRNDNKHILYLAPSFALIIHGIVMIEFKSNPLIRLLYLMGEASYSIYLAHCAAISLCFIFLRKTHILTMLDPKIAFFLIFIFSTVAGVATYFLIERPVLKCLHLLFPKTYAKRAH